jgi:hypothetical protein
VNTAPDVLGLTQIPGAMKDVAEELPTYRHVYDAAVNGRIPAWQSHGRWYLRRSDLRAAAEALGLKLIEEAGVR